MRNRERCYNSCRRSSEQALNTQSLQLDPDEASRQRLRALRGEAEPVPPKAKPSRQPMQKTAQEELRELEEKTTASQAAAEQADGEGAEPEARAEQIERTDNGAVTQLEEEAADQDEGMSLA